MTYSEIQQRLRQPFDIRTLTFRPGGRGVPVLTFVGVRHYQERLHQDAPGWQELDVSMVPVGNDVAVSLRLVIEGVSHVGVSDPDVPTKAYAQALKRACATHGLGAYLYDLPELPGVVVEDKKVKTNFLSIAVYIHEQLNISVPDDVYEDLDKVPAHLKYNPNARPSYPPREQPASSSYSPRAQAPQRRQNAENDPDQHKGKLSVPQAKKLYSIGLNDEDILAMNTADARQAVTDAFNGSSADDIRERYLGATVPAAPAASGRSSRSWGNSF